MEGKVRDFPQTPVLPHARSPPLTTPPTGVGHVLQWTGRVHTGARSRGGARSVGLHTCITAHVYNGPRPTRHWSMAWDDSPALHTSVLCPRLPPHPPQLPAAHYPCYCLHSFGIAQNVAFSDGLLSLPDLSSHGTLNLPTA